MQVLEGVGVVTREAGQRRARSLDVLVDHDARPVAERRALLDGRLDVGEAGSPQLEVAQERRALEPDVEIRMEVEAKARHHGLLGRAAAADPRAALEHERPQPGPHHVARERQTVVAGTDDDAVERARRHHSIPAKSFNDGSGWRRRPWLV